MIDCKNVLAEVNGDIQFAAVILRDTGHDPMELAHEPVEK